MAGDVATEGHEQILAAPPRRPCNLGFFGFLGVSNGKAATSPRIRFRKAMPPEAKYQKKEIAIIKV